MSELTELQNLSALDYIMAEEVSKPLIKYQQLTRWDDSTHSKYLQLVDRLKNCTSQKARNTKEAGDVLEALVTFLIQQSLFLEVRNNVRSATNEIDQIITFSTEGKLLLSNDNKIAELLDLGDKDSLIIGECKNYSSKVGVTYIGKLYGVMVAHDVSLSFLFTRKGITGKENAFGDGFGFIKVIRIYEKYKNNKEMFIIPFTLEDLEQITSAYDFFEMVKRKKTALRLSVLEQSMNSFESHCNSTAINEAVSKIKKVN